jgi:hypothetical protein
MMTEDDKTIRIIQSSTRGLLTSFRNKTQLLKECSDDIKLLIREGYNINSAQEAAKKLFGKYNIPFLAIDGTQSQDLALDMLIFYAGAFGYLGNLDFSSNKGCCYDEPTQIKGTMNISAAIPLHEEDAASVVGKKTEGGIEVDTGRLPSSLMHLAEYYMAVKTLYENPEIKVVLLDKTLSGDVAHLVWSVNEALDTDTCILQGIETEYGNISNLDLQLARMLHPNILLQIPVARSHLIKYAAISRLIEESENGTVVEISYDDLLNKMGANKDRMNKLVEELTDLDKRYCIFDSKNDHHVSCTLKFRQDVKNYWNRIFHASMKLSDHIFNTPEGKHPLMYENVQDASKKKWITADDLDYLTLVMIYALLRLAWEKKVLVIGLIKDVAAAELMKSVVPILQSSGKIKLSSRFPTFNSDKMLLQTNSIINAESIRAPWRTFEFDACFRTIAPLAYEEQDKEGDGIIIKKNKKNQAKVAGAFKNLISSERMFLKSYIQLWCSESDPIVRSHVFAYDRPCYPGFDKHGEILLHHKDGTVNEEIQPMIHFEDDGEISHLVMDILCSMSSEIIPECLGHNYPLFLADKKAKSILEGSRSAYVSAVAYEIANSQFDQQILFESKFREFRAQVESRRRGA